MIRLTGKIERHVEDVADAVTSLASLSPMRCEMFVATPDSPLAATVSTGLDHSATENLRWVRLTRCSFTHSLLAFSCTNGVLVAGRRVVVGTVFAGRNVVDSVHSFPLHRRQEITSRFATRNHLPEAFRAVIRWRHASDTENPACARYFSVSASNADQPLSSPHL